MGPLLVTWCDDGTVWVRGAPPLHAIWQLDDPPALTWFAAECARIEACDTPDELWVLAEELTAARGAETLAPYLRQWVDHRARMLAKGALRQSPGWGEPR